MSGCEQFKEGSRRWQICTGTAGLSLEKTNAYRKQWGLEPLEGDVVQSPPVVHRDAKPVKVTRNKRVNHNAVRCACAVPQVTYGPGTELLAIFKAAGVPSCQRCKDLAKKMNGWGVAGSRENMELILDDMVPRARKWIDAKSPWIPKLMPAMTAAVAHDWHLPQSVVSAAAAVAEIVGTPDAVLRSALQSIINESIAACERGDDKPKNKAPAQVRRFGGLGTAFRQQGKPRFVSAAQMQEDIKILLGKIPDSVTAVAGVARSGLSAATMVSMYLHLPMFTIRQNSHDIQQTGNGWRLGGTKHIEPGNQHVLIVDDTVMTGNSLKAIQGLLGQFKKTTTAAVYVNPAAKKKPDIWAVDLPWPHLLEWNLFNSILSPNMALDFDGILCQDCPAGSDDDGPKYLQFIRNAKPLYIPRRTPVPLIVTARVEKYRAETEAWMRRYGVQCGRLIMHPAAGTREREKDNIASFKARHLAAWAAKHRPVPPPLAFIESDDRQAREIAQITKQMVICPASAGVY